MEGVGSKLNVDQQVQILTEQINMDNEGAKTAALAAIALMLKASNAFKEIIRMPSAYPVKKSEFDEFIAKSKEKLKEARFLRERTEEAAQKILYLKPTLT